MKENDLLKMDLFSEEAVVRIPLDEIHSFPEP